MKILKILRTKKYRTRIFLWITSVMMITTILFSTIIYINAEKTVMNNEYESSQKFLKQMKFNIDFINDMVKNLCLSTFYSRDVQSLMNFTGEETFEQIEIMGKLSSSISSNPYVQSIYVYNNRKKVYYSTYSSFKYEDDNLKKLISEYKTVPVLKPIVRRAETYTVGEFKQYKDVVTYFMYELTDNQNQMNGAVILNIKLDWLINNLDQINMFKGKTKDRMFILDNKGEFISTFKDASSQYNEDFENELAASFNLKQKENPDNYLDFYKHRIGKKDYLVSYFKISEANWVLFKVQPFDEVFDYINKLKIMIIIITVIALLLILIVAFTISNRLYKPVEGLLKQVNYKHSESYEDKKNKDEFVFLQDVYKSSLERINEFSTSKRNNDKIIRMYFLKKLLFNSNSISVEEFEKSKAELDIQLDLDGSYVVIALKIDNFKQYENENNDNDRVLLQLALTNITTEIISREFICEAVETSNDEIVIIVSSKSFSNDINVNFLALLSEAQSIVKEYYQITFTAAISDHTKNIRELTDKYNIAVNNSKYRFVFGKMSIITCDMIKKNLIQSPMHNYFEAYKKLIEDLNIGGVKSLDKSLNNIFKDISQLEYNDMMLSLAYLVKTTLTSICEINETRIEPINGSLLSSNSVFEVETIDEFKECLLEVLIQYRQNEESSLISRDQQTAEAIKKFIDENYYKYDLSASYIAANFRISPAKVSKIFKENMGATSIPEYINSVRLSKAVEWMENSRLSIGEIINKIGIENESYFYKIFKAKYGSTPREYISSKLRK